MRRNVVRFSTECRGAKHAHGLRCRTSGRPHVGPHPQETLPMTTRPRRPSAAAARRLRDQLSAPPEETQLLPTDLATMITGFRPAPPLADVWPLMWPVVTEVMTASR